MYKMHCNTILQMLFYSADAKLLIFMAYFLHFEMWNHNAFILTEKGKKPLKASLLLTTRWKYFAWQVWEDGWHILLPHFKSPEEMSLCEAAFNANHSETLKTHDLEPLVCKRTQCRAPLWNTQSYISLNESKPLLFDNCAKPYHDYSFIWINRASVVARSVAQMLRYESCNKAKYLAWVLFLFFYIWP